MGYLPRVGCSSSTLIPRPRMCSSARTAAESSTAPTGPAARVVLAQVNAQEVDHGILVRDLQALAEAGGVPLDDGGEDPDRRVKPRPRVGKPPDGFGGGPARVAGHAHGPRHGLGDPLEA